VHVLLAALVKPDKGSLQEGLRPLLTNLGDHRKLTVLGLQVSEPFLASLSAC
jgi:hypothetical protein